MVVLIAIFYLTCALFPSFKHLILGWLHSEVGATWVGAIGTIFTLVGTIYLATDKDRKDKEVSERRAYVVAAKIAVPLDTYLDRIHGTYGGLMLRRDDEFWRRSQLISEGNAWGNLNISDDDLATLTVLDGNHAFRLARAMQLALDFLEQQKRIGARSGMQTELTERQMLEAAEKIHRIVDLLSVCSAFYSKIVERHAHDPSVAEVYGTSFDV